MAFTGIPNLEPGVFGSSSLSDVPLKKTDPSVMMRLLNNEIGNTAVKTVCGQACFIISPDLRKNSTNVHFMHFCINTIIGTLWSDLTRNVPLCVMVPMMTSVTYALFSVMVLDRSLLLSLSLARYLTVFICSVFSLRIFLKKNLYLVVYVSLQSLNMLYV